MKTTEEEINAIRNPQIVELIRSFMFRGEGAQRREVVQFHSLNGKFAGEYDPAICPTCRDYLGLISTFCTSDHK